MKIGARGFVILGIWLLSGGMRAYAGEKECEEEMVKAVCFLPKESDITSKLLQGMQERAVGVECLELSW